MHLQILKHLDSDDTYMEILVGKSSDLTQLYYCVHCFLYAPLFCQYMFVFLDRVTVKQE